MSSAYDITTVPFTGTLITAARLTNIQRLFDTGFRTLSLTNNAQSAGFQLALWAALYENSGCFNLSAGNFKTSNSLAAITAGEALLTGMSGPVTQTYDLACLQWSDSRAYGGHFSQDLVTAAPVPLPAGGLLLGAVGGLAALHRRKTRSATRFGSHHHAKSAQSCVISCPVRSRFRQGPRPVRE